MSWQDEYAYGGIVFNARGEVLMRSPAGFWGGYVWTFAKGGAELSDASPEETALREVREETGYTCEIIGKVPGEFASDTCITKYYLMKPIAKKADYDHETQEIRWVCTEQAFELMKLPNL
ncbi:NUDIX domain-containing protein [Alicyclobacillus fodiniaquatilis]|uniref:NUDIX domain-containing protein n=1 Tax=Alicyclobacillus fodiniaquatilis TaxID=1661150 RepID=A0ABW4JPW7_9BACL